MVFRIVFCMVVLARLQNRKDNPTDECPDKLRQRRVNIQHAEVDTRELPGTRMGTVIVGMVEPQHPTSALLTHLNIIIQVSLVHTSSYGSVPGGTASADIDMAGRRGLVDLDVQQTKRGPARDGPRYTAARNQGGSGVKAADPRGGDRDQGEDHVRIHPRARQIGLPLVGLEQNGLDGPAQRRGRTRCELLVHFLGRSNNVGQQDRRAERDEGEDYECHAPQASDVPQCIVFICRACCGGRTIVAVVDFSDERGRVEKEGKPVWPALY